MKKRFIKLGKEIAFHYNCHGVKLKLHPINYNKATKRFIFQLTLKPGTKVNDVFSYASDVGAALGMPLFQPFREDIKLFLAASTITTTDNSLAKMFCSDVFCSGTLKLPIALGYDLVGRMVFDDLAQTPHAMYVGATNSGKSVGLSSLILSLTCSCPVSEVNLVLFDIGGGTLDLFNDIPHLSHPIVKDHDTAVNVLSVMADELERRVNLGEQNCQNLPAIVCIIDEYVSFIDNIETPIQKRVIKKVINNILRTGRKAKMHMVLATQDPKKDSMLVDINNISSRMAFKCAKFQTSINIINVGGAEKLPGKGAMFHISEKYNDPIYVQGSYMPNDEVKKLIDRINEMNKDREDMFIIPRIYQTKYESLKQLAGIPARDEEALKFCKIMLRVLECDTISAQQLKDEFSMGNRVSTIIGRLFDLGIISGKDGNKARRVLVNDINGINSDAVELLQKNGFSTEDIENALHKRAKSDFSPQSKNADESESA